MTTDNLLLVGYITGAFGIRGQVKLKAITDYPDHLEQEIHTLYIRRTERIPSRKASPEAVEYSLVQAKQQKPGVMILTLSGVTSREQADDLRHSEVFIDAQEAVPLEENEYFIHELYGLRVETTDGDEIGSVRDVLETGANDVLVIGRQEKSEVLIPMIHDVVQDVDVSGGRIVIRLMDGLIEV